MRRAHLALLFVASCYGPTEIKVDVTTNACKSLQGTDVYIDGQKLTHVDAGVPACDPNDPTATVDLGTIAVLPSHGIDSNVDIAIVGNVGGNCDSPDTTDTLCIVARRSLDFIPHQELQLPIFLDSACAGIQCKADETCVVDETGAHCAPSGCKSGETCVADAGGPDVGVGDAIAFDALPPPACPSIFAAPFGQPTFSWSFHKTIADDGGQIVPTPPLEATSAIVAAPPTFCGDDYLLSKSAQALATSMSSNFSSFSAISFAVGFAYNASADGALLALVTSSQFGGWSISLANGAVHLSLNIGNQANPIYVGKAATTSGWHRFGFQVASNGTSSLVTPYEDGAPQTAIKTGPYTAGAPAAFSVGAGAFDNVVFYAQ